MNRVFGSALRFALGFAGVTPAATIVRDGKVPVVPGRAALPKWEKALASKSTICMLQLVEKTRSWTTSARSARRSRDSRCRR